MAKYYNIVTSSNGTLTIEDASQYYVDGQPVQLLHLENIGNGGNVSPGFVTYATPTQARDQALFSPQTFSLGRQIATHIDSRQNVYIIKPNDSSTPQNVELQLVNPIINSPEIKTVSVNTNSEGQQMQWISTHDNTINVNTVLKENVVSPVQVVSPVRNQQNNITLNPDQFARTELLVQNSVDKKESKLIKTVTRQGNVVQARLLTSPDGRQIVDVHRVQNKTLPLDVPIALSEKTSPSMSKVAQHPGSYPEMEHLSERIRSAAKLKLQSKQNPQPVTKPVGVATGIPMGNLINRQGRATVPSPALNRMQAPRQATPRPQFTSTPASPVFVPRQIRTPMKTPRQVTPNKQPTNQRQVQRTVPQPVQRNESIEEDDSDTSTINHEPESTLHREEIKNPQTAIVQKQIKGNVAKMLVALQSGEQRLITFDIPKEECTVHDLLEQVRNQAGIQYTASTTVSLVLDSTPLSINYIVDAGSCVSSPTDTTDADTSNSNVDSSSPAANTNEETNVSSSLIKKAPRYVPGKLAVCPVCGMTSGNLNKCDRCRRDLPPNVKIVLDGSVTKITAYKEGTTFNKQSKFLQMKKPDHSQKLEMLEKDVAKRILKRAPGRAKKAAPKEPECLIISSDEEDNGKKAATGAHPSVLANSNDQFSADQGSTILDKEPLISHSSEKTNVCEEKKLMEILHLDQIKNLKTEVDCRTVRIGSYRFEPVEKVLITANSLRIMVPLLEDENFYVPLEIPMNEIVKVLIHFGKTMPVLFYYTTLQSGAKIREILGMQDPKSFYYDPAGKDHLHKRISLLAVSISEESKQIIKRIYELKMEELSNKEANEILVRASPQDNSCVRRSQQQPATSPNCDIQTIALYPKLSGGITINTEDYMCLGEDQFLNDVIIDFYLKYITLEILSSVDQNRTHVFSSYFYKRLTSPTAAAAGATNLSAAAKRHARVQKWTKNVNIFKKDFVIIPINEHAHWFLAIICFPGLVGKVATSPVVKKDKPSKPKPKPGQKEMKIALKIGSTTITPVTATTITIDQGDDGSERDEAEGDDDEMEMDSTDDETDPKPATEKQGTTEPSNAQQTVINKMPCILIFDSLAGASRSRVVATLRDYLACEYLAKMGTEKIFSKDTIKGSNVKVPQQTNFTDCGLYVLQYVESFFKSPITDYRLPIKTLKNWFEEIVVTRKREEISKLLIQISNGWKGERDITLPTLVFPTQNGKLKKTEGSETKAIKTEADTKKKATEMENKPEPMDTSESATESQKDLRNELVPYSSSSSPSPDEPTSERLMEVLPSRIQSTDTLTYLKKKRITRIVQKQSETQESETPLKKHKGDSPE